MKEIDTAIDMSTQQRLIEMALTTEDGLAKMEKLIAMQEAAEAKRAKHAFYENMTAMQAVMPVIKKKSQGQHSRYAELDQIALEIQPVLPKFGFSYRWEQVTNENGCIRVTCVITHVGGHSETNVLQGHPDVAGPNGNATKNPLQGSASTVSYLRRYTLTGGFGILCAGEDIDGRVEGATQRQLTASNSMNMLLAAPVME